VSERSAAARQGDPIRIVLADLLGGVTSYALDLTALEAFQRRGAQLLWLESALPGATRLGVEASVPSRRVRYEWPGENAFAVLRRMQRALGPGRGALVANEFFGLAFGARHGAGAPLVQILHGDIPFYYRLAEEFEPWVDAFVAVSERVAKETARRLPRRIADVHHLPTGVPLPARLRTPVSGPLRLVYSGRIERNKGVLDLPAIDRRLRRDGVQVIWSVIGSGPDEPALRRGFDAEAKVAFTGAQSPDACRALLPDHDVLVLPSYGEGLPLSLLEAMGAGLVPVVSDLESGIREVVDDGVNGWLARPGQPDDFAVAIARLHHRRDRLEDCSRAAAERVRTHHSLRERGEAWLDLIGDLEERPPRQKPIWRRGPSRLDRPWLPNWVVRGVRRLVR